MPSCSRPSRPSEVVAVINDPVVLLLDAALPHPHCAFSPGGAHLRTPHAAGKEGSRTLLRAVAATTGVVLIRVVVDGVLLSNSCAARPWRDTGWARSLGYGPLIVGFASEPHTRLPLRVLAVQAVCKLLGRSPVHSAKGTPPIACSGSVSRNRRRVAWRYFHLGSNFR